MRPQIVDLVSQLHNLIVVYVESHFPLCGPVARLICGNVHSRSHFSNITQEAVTYQVVHALTRLTGSSRKTGQFFGGIRNIRAQIKNVFRHFFVVATNDFSAVVRQSANVFRHIQHFAFKRNRFFRGIDHGCGYATGGGYCTFGDILRELRCAVCNAPDLRVRQLHRLRK